jgi:transposase
MLHRTRHLFVRQRTTLINALRAHLAEFGSLQTEVESFLDDTRIA